MPRVTDARLRWLDWVCLAGVAVAAVVFRFVTTSPLWLDEALSVNIARLPIGDIPEALRHDGHPPLYYFLLHGWMDVFGESDGAVRALSGLFGLSLFPLMWVAGRRIAGRRGAVGAVLVLALSPYAVRYSTETRMYSMVMVLALGAWLLAGDALRRPTIGRLAGLAALTGALLLSHYWAMWYLGAAALGLIVHGWQARRDGRIDDLRATVRIVGALAAGALLFLPWVPSLLYQSANTGTPWAGPIRPTEVVAQSVVDLGGGLQGEAVLLGMATVVLILLGVFGRAVDRRHIELDLRTRLEARPAVLVVLVTIAIATIVGYVTSTAYATRYLAVLVPLIILSAALGLARFGGRLAFRLVAAGILLLGLAGSIRNVITDRTQAGAAGTAIDAIADPGDLVITCPDQLGPAVERAVDRVREVVTYPDFEPAERVDWVDYVDRHDATNPADFGAEALRRGADRTIWFVWTGTYITHEGTCERVLNTIQQARPWLTTPVIDDGEEYFEHESVYRFPAREGG